MRQLTEFEIKCTSGGNWLSTAKEYIGATCSAAGGLVVGLTAATYCISRHNNMNSNLAGAMLISGAYMGLVAGNYLYQGLYALRKANDFPTG